MPDTNRAGRLTINSSPVTAGFGGLTDKEIEINLPKTVPAGWMRQAKVGSSICCAGHTSHCRTPLVKAGFGFTCNKAWLVLMSSEQPVPVTILTISEFPEEPTWGRK